MTSDNVALSYPSGQLLGQRAKESDPFAVFASHARFDDAEVDQPCMHTAYSHEPFQLSKSVFVLCSQVFWLWPSWLLSTCSFLPRLSRGAMSHALPVHLFSPTAPAWSVYLTAALSKVEHIDSA